MDGINRTGGTQEAVVSAAVKARMERLAQEAAKYKLPGAAAGLAQKDSEKHAAPPPMNLAQLRAWVETHDGGIDVLA